MPRAYVTDLPSPNCSRVWALDRIVETRCGKVDGGGGCVVIKAADAAFPSDNACCALTGGAARSTIDPGANKGATGGGTESELTALKCNFMLRSLCRKVADDARFRFGSSSLRAVLQKAVMQNIHVQGNTFFTFLFWVQLLMFYTLPSVKFFAQISTQNHTDDNPVGLEPSAA